MKCPYCTKEMEKGFMQGASRMIWTPKLHHIFLIKPSRKEIMFTGGIIKACACTAYLCRDCKKIVMDYDDRVAITR